MERIFRTKLKRQLQKRIKGDIRVYSTDDVLNIVIQIQGLCMWYYTINNIATQLSTGLSSRIVADVIVKQYKKYILSHYFYTK